MTNLDTFGQHMSDRVAFPSSHDHCFRMLIHCQLLHTLLVSLAFNCFLAKDNPDSILFLVHVYLQKSENYENLRDCLLSPQKI
jgi:hypothetical protein